MAIDNRSSSLKRLTRWRRWLVVAALALATADVHAAAGVVRADSESLRGQYVALESALRDSPFGRPLHLESRESGRELRGDVYARLDHPFAQLAPAVRDAAPWCAILSLHLNVRRCIAIPGSTSSTVTAYLGGKRDAATDPLQRLDFVHRADVEATDYIRIVLDAKAGPFGTRDHRIVLEATPVGPGATFVHLSYSHAYGPLAALALRTYLRTAGAAKRGFTIVGRRPDGQPVYVGDVRGLLERNTMRYFLALDAYLGACAAPPAEQFERRLLDWFAATERYAEQLHEVSLDEYLTMKRDAAIVQTAP